MRYVVEGEFQTDSDFGIRLSNLDRKFRKAITFNGYERYSIYFKTKNVQDVEDFLEQLIVSFSVVSTHYWLLRDLYNLISPLIEALWDENRTSIKTTLSSNYDWTEIGLYKVEE